MREVTDGHINRGAVAVSVAVTEAAPAMSVEPATAMSWIGCDGSTAGVDSSSSLLEQFKLRHSAASSPISSRWRHPPARNKRTSADRPTCQTLRELEALYGHPCDQQVRNASHCRIVRRRDGEIAWEVWATVTNTCDA